MLLVVLSAHGSRSTQCGGPSLTRRRLRQQGKSDPKLGPDEEYPPWLWTLTAPAPMEGELQKKLQEAGYSGKPGPHDEELPISIKEAQRLLYLQRKRIIKGSNEKTKGA